MYKRILVPVDGSPTSIHALDEAIRLAKQANGTIRLVHVLDRIIFAGGETHTGDVFGLLREVGEQILQQMQEHAAVAGMEVSTYLSEVQPGRVCDVVAEQAKAFDADLIVVGTHGRRGVSRLLVGSDAEQIVRMAPVPVLVVRGEASAAFRTGAEAARKAKGAP
jgi:nucleotide-binding universal stress UspA family protein